MATKRKSRLGSTDPLLAKAKKKTAGSKENVAPIRRSGRTTKGQGGELQDDTVEKARARLRSRKGYTSSTDDPKRLDFYPPQWHDVLERAQKLWRSWMAFERGFPEREIEEHLNKAMQCVTDALSEHKENGGEVENGVWEEHQDDMREYIFADQSTFREIIKTEAAKTVQHHYDYFPEEFFNNQLGESYFISEAIETLLYEGNFLHDGRDDLGRTNNLTHPAIEGLSIFIYKLAAPSLSAEFENGIPCKVIALAISAITCCLDAWRLGLEMKKDFTADPYELTYIGVLKLIEKLRQHPYHWEKFTAARRTWAGKANVNHFTFSLVATDVCKKASGSSEWRT